MKINIRTKKMPCGSWSCYATYKGVDKAFVGNNISVVAEMSEWIKDENINIIWHDPVIHKPHTKKNKYRFRRPRIDIDMV